MVDDDYSPEEAFRRFSTPSRTSNHSNEPARTRLTPDDIFDIMNRGMGGADNSSPDVIDPLSDTIASAVIRGGGGGYNQFNNTTGYVVNESFIDLLDPLSDVDVWIFGERKDVVFFPVLLGVIGLLAVIGNVFVLLAFFSNRRMRIGQNLMLVNVSIADIVFVLVSVPVAILNNMTGFGAGTGPGGNGISSGPPPQLCRFVHYVIFVGVYVSIYTLVVTCVFRFFGEFMRSTTTVGESKKSSSGTISSALGSGRVAPSLTLGNASLSCAVIWVAFMTSHLNFLIQNAGAIFEDQFICEHHDGPTDMAKLRTLWVTFMTCAILLPLLIVCSLSALILHRGGRQPVAIETRRISCSINDTRRLTNELQCGYGVERLANKDDMCGYSHSDCQPPCDEEYEHRSPNRMSVERRYLQEEYNEVVSGPHGDIHQEPVVRYLANGRGVATEAYNERYHLVNGAAGYESVQNNKNDATSRRELTIVVLVTTVIRCLCWLPIQIFMLVDVFTENAEYSARSHVQRRDNTNESDGESIDVYRQIEMIAICFAYFAAAINPFIYNCACAEFRRINARMLSACCWCFRRADRLHHDDVRTSCGHGMISVRPASPGESLSKPVCADEGGAGLRLADMNETIMSIISDSSNRINYA